jgi:hypothetical protein
MIQKGVKVGLAQQERNRLNDIVDTVVNDTPRGSIRGKFDDPRYFALCQYFNMKFDCGGFVADVHAQDVMEILDLIDGKRGTV